MKTGFIVKSTDTSKSTRVWLAKNATLTSVPLVGWVQLAVIVSPQLEFVFAGAVILPAAVADHGAPA